MTTNGHAHPNGHSNYSPIPLDVLKSDLLHEPLSTEDLEALGACFDSHTVFADALTKEVSQRLLPKVAKRMGWARATCRKLRANTSTSVSIRYNSDFHRDRHLFGSAPQNSKERQVAAWNNVSAVIYLDAASFSYIEESAWDNPKQRKTVEKDYPAGTMIFFPSSLVHKATESKFETTRRTIIAFDLEDADIQEPIPHAIVRMPSIMQWAAFHLFLRNDQVESVVFYYLFSDSLYGWRFLPRWCRQASLCRVHWQITAPPAKEQKLGEVPHNSSIYMPPTEQKHVTFYDYSWFFGYVWRLIDAYTFRYGYSR